MSDTNHPYAAGFELPRRMVRESQKSIAAPGHESFTSRFGDAFPPPRFLTSDLGTTATYRLPPPSGRESKSGGRRVLMVHGLNTPALGLLALARQLQKLDAGADVVLFDLWGHGLSSTPLVAHAAHIFHAQILQVLGSVGWASAHLLGYSFGGSIVARFALYHPWAAESVALLAPVGVMNPDVIATHVHELLADSSGGREAEAIKTIMDWLEGGPTIVVPPDWKERAARGEIVGEALREWELQEHRGYPYSVLSMFREDNVFGKEDEFRGFACLPLRKVVVLADGDIVCSKDQLIDLGFEHVEVVEQANHGFVRSRSEDVARIVHSAWTTK